MKTIRKSVFETNSSSIHALCISNTSENIIEELEIHNKNWDCYNIYIKIQEGKYNELDEDIKDTLKLIGFDLNLISDDDYVYDLIYNNSKYFNSSSGMGGEFDIKKYSIEYLYERYKKLIDNNITLSDFISKFNWENYDLDKLINIDIDWARYKTLDYIKSNLEILDSDELNSESKFFIMKDGIDIYELLSDYEYINYMKSEITKKGCEKVKKEFHEFHKERKIEKIIKSLSESSPMIFNYLKENNII